MRRAAECKVAALQQHLDEFKAKSGGVHSEDELTDSDAEPEGVLIPVYISLEQLASKEVGSKTLEEKVIPTRKRQRTLHVEDLEVLSELIPPTDNIEFAYAWEREIFFLYTL